MSPPVKKLVARCPICKKEVTWGDSPHRPFCSERCKLIDLGEWLSEGYRVSSPLEDESEPTDRPQDNG